MGGSLVVPVASCCLATVLSSFSSLLGERDTRWTGEEVVLLLLEFVLDKMIVWEEELREDVVISEAEEDFICIADKLL